MSKKPTYEALEKRIRELEQAESGRKQAEEALSESEEKFRLAFQTNPDSINISRMRDGLYIDVNEGFLRIMGYEREQVLGRTSIELNIWDDPNDRRRLVRGLQANGFVENLSVRFRRKDGSIRHGLMSACVIELKGEKCLLSITRDITDKKKAEEALRESEHRFRELAELLPETIFEVDAEGRLTFVNRKAFEKFGYTKEDYEAGLNAFQMISEEDQERAKKNFQRIVQGENIGIREYNALRKDGTTFPSLFHSTPIQKEGKTVGLRGFIIDISQERRLEAQLKQSQKMEAIGTLAGGVAHDFNNILGVIVGNTELALLDTPTWHPAQENLRAIREASLRARDLVNQILLFARQKEHNIATVRVEPIAKESLKMLRASIPTTVEMEQEIKKDLPSVTADPTQIQQIIMNLCTNAAQVMEAEGGTLAFTMDVAELEAPLDTSTGYIPEGRYLCIQVRDTGPGIEPENLDRIFEPFFTTKGIGEGTGLGLAVVHGIVQERNGGIAVETGRGIGTTFTVYLPAAEESGVQEKREDESELPTGTERILFVDDEPMIMKLGQRMLERQGYQVEARANGTDALACFKRDPERFDLVLTDMTMPGLRGDNLARELMKIRPDIPVILSTGFSNQISEEKAREMGIRAFVTKPLTAHVLANTVRRVLDEK
jgi:PAS domain S-box-containing protein